jgi:hypothetical protein
MISKHREMLCDIGVGKKDFLDKNMKAGTTRNRRSYQTKKLLQSRGSDSQSEGAACRMGEKFANSPFKED